MTGTEFKEWFNGFFSSDVRGDIPIYDSFDQFRDVIIDRFDAIKKHTKKIKLEAWISDVGELRWLTENHFGKMDGFWHRVPSEDKWVEVEE